MDDDDVIQFVDNIRRAHRMEVEAERLRKYTKRIEGGMARIAERLLAECAHAAALEAVVRAFMASHPDSPLMAEIALPAPLDLDEHSPKRRFDVVLENEFFRVATENGLTNVRPRHIG